MNHKSPAHRHVGARAVLMFALLATPSFSQKTPEAPEPEQPQPPEIEASAESPALLYLGTTPRLTGDWGGLRTRMEDQGVQLKIKLMSQYMVNMHGGLETRNGFDTAGNYELNFTFDMEKLAGIEGASLFLRGKGTWGGDDSDFDKEKIGGIFKTNQDASSEEPIFVDKWWWRQQLWDEQVELRFGRMEPVKDIFDTSQVMGNEDDEFLNGSLVRNPTIPGDKGLGLFINWNVTDQFYIRAAGIDAESEDRQTNFNTAFHDADEFRFYAEVGIRPELESAKGKLWGHYRMGTWYDSTRKRQFFDTIGGRLADRHRTGDWGFNVGFDQMIWKENADEADKQGIAVAARYGYAPGEVNTIEHFWATAIQYEGIVPDRDKDVLAFGVAQGKLSDELRRRERPGADRETVFELYYEYVVSPWLSITPDFQFILDAGGDNEDNDTAVAMIRVKMSL